ncbi:MAG: hypothetical protein HY741_01930 [Chloroflexi bacterium]|nr:hypothetical protein [Chloroflexota bacterium]
MIHRITTLLLALAAFGLLSTLALHVFTFLRLELEPLRPLYALAFIGVFVVVVPMIFFGSRAERKNADAWSKTMRYAPRGWNAFVVVLLLYVAFNFFTMLNANSSASPTIKDGKYVLTSHGAVVKQLTASEYTQAVAYDLRLWSGHPLVFYAGAFGFLYAMKRELDSLHV